MLIEVINSSRNIQMSGPLLELCRGPMVVFQVKVLQVMLVRQFVVIFTECFTFRLLPRSPLLARANPLTLVAPEKQLDPSILVVSFFCLR